MPCILVDFLHYFGETCWCLRHIWSEYHVPPKP